MIQGSSIAALYRQWLKDGLHEIMQYTGQGALLDWKSASEVIKESLWEMEGVLRSSGYQGADNLLFYALFQRLCSQKLGANGVFTLEAYPSEEQQEELLEETLKGRVVIMRASSPDAGWRRRFSRMGIFLCLVYLIGSVLLGTYWYMNLQKTQAQLEEKEDAYQSLLQDYEKVYDAYYQLETKFVQLSKRPYKKFNLLDTTRRIGANIHWFADEGEVMLNIDSLPPLDSGEVYMIFARTKREMTSIGSFDQPLKMFEMGDFEPVMAPLGFSIRCVNADTSIVVVSSD